ncbi:MAG: hypothetical protein WD402_04425 [Chloroflexota bacterium]
MGLVLALIAAFPNAAVASHSWGSYHWARTTATFTLLVGDNVSNTWDPYLDGAIADWTAAPSDPTVADLLDLAETAGGTNPRNCRPTAGRIEACSAKYGYTGWLGLAQIWVSGSHITRAITKVNDTYFNTATYNTPAWRRLVMCQEIAHDFGLTHQDEVFNNRNLGSCMDYTNDPDGGPGGFVNDDPSNEHPNTHDFEQIQTIYGGHTDSTSTVGQVTAAGAPGNAPASWGQLVRGSRAAGVSLYVLDLGNGQRVYTHVIWAR